MFRISRRKLLQALGLGAAGAGAVSSPWWLGKGDAFAAHKTTVNFNDFYKVPMKGDARILHITDVHGQLLPVYFREPNVNLGLGDAKGRPPHLVGKSLLKEMGLHEGSIEEYAYTYINFEENARKYGRMGGYAHIKTLLDMLRVEAGGIAKTLTIDGGDTWQGSATSLWTRGKDMVNASNILGVEYMTGHWEFTFKEEEVLANLGLFKGEFLGQNVRVKEDSLFGDEYPAMVKKYDGRGLFDEDNGNAFKPYAMKEVGGRRFAIIGQAFPRTANANPQENFPDWSFGLRDGDLRGLVKKIRSENKPHAVIMLSHNGMDVDIKMAGEMSGIDAIFGGHTHDGVPMPISVKDRNGGTCLVTNAGSNGKFVGVMDFEFDGEAFKQAHYKMLPVMEKGLPADKEMQAYLDKMRSTKYDDKVVASRNPLHFFSKKRVGRTYQQVLEEKLAIAGETLYRRGNFMGTWDQVVCNALRQDYGADIALSPGVRWGTSTLKGDWITMEDVMTQCSMTYGETYMNEMTGKQVIAVLEAVADNLFDPDPYLQSGGDMVRVGGLDYTIDPTKKFNTRITEARLDNGELLQPEKKYKVAGWAVVGRAPEGRLVWDIVRDYIIKNRGKDMVLKLAKINHPKLVGVSDNPGLADYPGQTA